MASLQSLTGLVVGRIENVHDYLQIVFSEGATLTIFNNYVYGTGSLLGLEGKAVKSVEESDSSVTILFEGGDFFTVGLRDCDFNGPEAMVLRQEGKPPVVWR